MDNRYYFSKIFGDKVIIEGNEAQHLSKVRRARIGDEIVAFNGDGMDYHLEVTEITKDKVSTIVLNKTANKAMSENNITVYLAMLKNDALVTAIDNLAELNVRSVKIFKGDFSVAVIDEKKLEKLNQTSIQASKQCERADVMKVSLIDKKDIINDCLNTPNNFFAYEDATQKLTSFSGDFSVIIGCEGGFSPKEVEFFSSFARPISLGKTILRAPVACVSSVAMLKAVNNEG